MDREQDAVVATLKVFAWVLLVAGLLPFDHYGETAIWPWQGLMDASVADGATLLLPFAGSVLCFLLADLRLGKTVRATVILLFIVGAWAVQALSERSPHPLEVYRRFTEALPHLLSRSFWLLLLGLVLLAGGLRLGAEGFLEPLEGRPSQVDPLLPARLLTALGIVLVALFYCLPYHGVVPIVLLGRDVRGLFGPEGGAAGLTSLAERLLATGPLVFALLALWRLFRRAPESGGMLAGVSLAYIPGLCLLVGLRNFVDFPSFTLVHIRSAMLILAIGVGGAMALPALIRGSWFQLPWAFGRLGDADRLLAFALSRREPEKALDGLLRRLHPLARLFVRRRLRLWQSAAAEVPGPDAGDLPRLMALLASRFSEERDGTSAPAALAPGDPLLEPPPWWTGHRLDGVCLFLVGAVVAGMMLAGRRGDSSPPCAVGEDDPALSKLFSDDLPAVVSELSMRSGELESMPSYFSLVRSLDAVEERVPGLLQRMIELLRLGRMGRCRLHRLRRALDDINGLLQRDGAPYTLVERVRPRPGGADLFLLLSYHVMHCREYRLAGSAKTYRVLLLSRADDLNVVESYLGATEGEEIHVSILLDRLDDFISGELLPLAEREDAVGETVRGSARAAGGGLEPGAGVDGPLGELLLEGLIRHELHHRWLGLNPAPPAALWAWMGGYSEEAVQGVASEAGALLGELSSQAAYGRLRIAIMLEGLKSEAGFGSTHGMATRFVLKRLFGLEDDSLLAWKLYQGEQLLKSLAELGDEQLLERIDSCHQALFGVPAPRFEAVHPI